MPAADTEAGRPQNESVSLSVLSALRRRGAAAGSHAPAVALRELRRGRAALCAPHVGADVLGMVRERIVGSDGVEERVPLWCPWPLPSGWTVTGVAWAGDERTSPRATALALSGPAPFSSGPADIVFVAEELGVGLGRGLGGLGLDPGPGARARWWRIPRRRRRCAAAGHPTPLWAVPAGPDRSVYVGEARAMWLYAVAWPARRGVSPARWSALHDLAESVPAELVYGAESGRVRPRPVVTA